MYVYMSQGPLINQLSNLELITASSSQIPIYIILHER